MNYFKTLSCLIILFLSAGTLHAQEQDVRTIRIEGTDQLKFSVKTIEAHPGETLKIHFSVTSRYDKASMAHNWVLLKASAEASEVARKSADNHENEYIDPKVTDTIIAHTRLLGDGESDTITIKAPEKPGEYTYLCTFPGHYMAGMKGTLEVEPNSTQ